MNTSATHRLWRRLAVLLTAIIGLLGLSAAAYAATSSASSATHTSSAARTVVPRCTAADLGVWIAVDQGNGAAGTVAYPLQFTNLSHHTCSLTGNPGVSVLGRSGQRLGSPASWAVRTGARTVYLAPGATAHTMLAYHSVAVQTTPGCSAVNSATQLSVIPPDQRTATHAAFSFPACSRPGVIYLTVLKPIQPGPGTING